MQRKITLQIYMVLHKQFHVGFNSAVLQSANSWWRKDRYKALSKFLKDKDIFASSEEGKK